MVATLQRHPREGDRTVGADCDCRADLGVVHPELGRALAAALLASLTVALTVNSLSEFADSGPVFSGQSTLTAVVVRRRNRRRRAWPRPAH